MSEEVVEQPVKRKRGRPRKSETVTSVKSAPKKTKSRNEPSEDVEIKVASKRQLMLFEDVDTDLSVFKDDMSTMEHPFFSVSHNVDTSIFEYERGDVRIRVIPTMAGRPTQNDKDFLIYLASKFQRKQFDDPNDILLYRRIEVSLSDFARVTHRSMSGNLASSFLRTLERLRGATIQTNIRMSVDDLEAIHGFSFLDEYKILRESSGRGVLKAEVTISEWYAKQIRDRNVLTIDSNYFDLKRPMDKRLYELIRKHTGYQPVFTIGLDILKDKMGVAQERHIRFFRSQVRQIVLRNELPNYDLAFDAKADKLVVFIKDHGAVFDWLMKNNKMDWYGTLFTKENNKKKNKSKVLNLE